MRCSSGWGSAAKDFSAVQQLLRGDLARLKN